MQDSIVRKNILKNDQKIYSGHILTYGRTNSTKIDSTKINKEVVNLYKIKQFIFCYYQIDDNPYVPKL